MICAAAKARPGHKAGRGSGRVLCRASCQAERAPLPLEPVRCHKSGWGTESGRSACDPGRSPPSAQATLWTPVHLGCLSQGPGGGALQAGTTLRCGAGRACWLHSWLFPSSFLRQGLVGASQAGLMLLVPPRPPGFWAHTCSVRLAWRFSASSLSQPDKPFLPCLKKFRVGRGGVYLYSQHQEADRGGSL